MKRVDNIAGNGITVTGDVAVNYKIVAIETVEAIGGAKPEESIFILYDPCDRGLQAMFYSIMIKGKIGRLG